MSYVWDKNFTLDNCTFDSSRTIARIDDVKKWAWLILDEAGQLAVGSTGGGAPARTFMSYRNKAVTSVAQTFRDDDKLASLFLVSILPFHVDKILRQLCDFYIVMYGRGIGKVYQVRRSVFTGKLRTPRLCNLRVTLDGIEDLLEAYRDKRRKIVTQRRREYLEEIKRREQEERKKSVGIEWYADKIIEDDLLDSLTAKGKEIGDRGWFKRARCRTMFKVGHMKADAIKKTLENRLANE